jgi:hypothetical protein
MLRNQSIQDTDEIFFHGLSYGTNPGEWADRVIQHPFLPPEILSKIFIQTGAFLDINIICTSDNILWLHQYFQAPLNQLFAILLVCKDWYDAARETKGLYQQRISLDYGITRKPIRFLRYLSYINPHWPLTIVLSANSSVPSFCKIYPMLMDRLGRLEDFSGTMMEEYAFRDVPPASRLEELELNCRTYPDHKQVSSGTVPASSFPVLRLLKCHLFPSRHFKHNTRTHIPLIESSTLQEVAYSDCHVAVDDWIAQTKHSPALKKVTLTKVKWYRSPEQVAMDRAALVEQMLRHLSNLETLVIRELEVETDPASFELAVVGAMISCTGLTHLILFSPSIETPSLIYPRCPDHPPNLTKVTLSLSSLLADERLSKFVTTTASWLSTLPNLLDLELEWNDRLPYSRYKPDVTPLLIAVHSRVEANLLINLSHISLNRCTFDSDALLSPSYTRSLSPHGILPPGSRKPPIRFTLLHCRTRLNMTCRQKAWKSRLVRAPDIKHGSWEMLRSAIVDLEMQANAKMINGQDTDAVINSLYGWDAFGFGEADGLQYLFHDTMSN